MAVHASLRFEPVGCVVTIIAEGGHDVHVLEIVSERSEVVLRRPDRDDHFSDIHGSIVFIGNYPSSVLHAQGGAIVELPTGRMRLNCNVVARPNGDGIMLRLTDPLQGAEIRAHCRIANAAVAEPEWETPNASVAPISKLSEV